MNAMKKPLAAACALGLMLAPTSVLAEDLEILLTNLSSRALMVFQTSPSDIESWQEDVLGGSYLPAGNEVPVVIADGSDACVYDMRFIMEDESVLEHFDVDLCETASYTLYDE